MELLTGGIIALVAAFIGYQVRIWEHRREQRVDAYRQIMASFHEAARTGTELLSVHTQTGFPHELNQKQLPAEAIEKMTAAHKEAFARAREARQRFDLAAFNVELVGSQGSLEIVEQLRTFLRSALYSGVPWKATAGYPEAGLGPVEIVPTAIETARPLVEKLSDELWGSRWRKRR